MKAGLTGCVSRACVWWNFVCFSFQLFMLTGWSSHTHCIGVLSHTSSKAAVSSHLFLPWHVHSSQPWKWPVASHIIIPVSHYSFNVYICGVAHRHVKNTKNKWWVHSFFLSLPPSLSPCCVLALLSGVKENHIIIFIDNYQRQTPYKPIGQAGGTLLQQDCLYEHTHQWAAA